MPSKEANREAGVVFLEEKKGKNQLSNTKQATFFTNLGKVTGAF